MHNLKTDSYPIKGVPLLRMSVPRSHRDESMEEKEAQKRTLFAFGFPCEVSKNMVTLWMQTLIPDRLPSVSSAQVLSDYKIFAQAGGTSARVVSRASSLLCLSMIPAARSR